MTLREKLLNFIQKSHAHKYTVGAAFLFMVIIAPTYVIFGAINQISVYNQDQEFLKLKAQPYTDFFQYEDILAEEQYVGEPLMFTSVRSGKGNYPTTYLDKIFCPSNNRSLVAISLSQGSIKDTKGEVETSKWTYGSFVPGEEFNPTIVNEPKEDCYVESLIVAEVAPEVFKQQLLISKAKFNIVTRGEDK